MTTHSDSEQRLESGDDMMAAEFFCPECGHPIDPGDVLDSAQSGFESECPASADWVPVARFPQSADAVYFAEELERQFNFEVDIAMRERHDATHGQWSLGFDLLVDLEQLSAARLALQLLQEDRANDDQRAVGRLDRSASHGDHPTPESCFEQSAATPVLAWSIGVFGLVVAGFLGAAWRLQIDETEQRIRNLEAKLAEQRGRAADWMLAISAGGSTWEQPIAGFGTGRRWLRFDDVKRTLTVATDADGDGQSERSTSFQALDVQLPENEPAFTK